MIDLEQNNRRRGIHALCDEEPENINADTFNSHPHADPQGDPCASPQSSTHKGAQRAGMTDIVPARSPLSPLPPLPPVNSGIERSSFSDAELRERLASIETALRSRIAAIEAELELITVDQHAARWPGKSAFLSSLCRLSTEQRQFQTFLLRLQTTIHLQP